MYHKRMGVVVSSALVSLLVASGAHADTVRMKNGDVLTGTVSNFDDENLKLTTSYAGVVTIASSQVVSVSTDAPVVVKLGGGREVVGRLSADASGGLILTSSEGASTPMKLSEVSFAPPKPPKPWFRYKGELNAGVNGASGNTDSVGYHLDGSVRPQFGVNALSLKGQLNRTENTVDGTDETTVSNWRVLGQYDRFFTDHWYGFFNNGWENDDLKELNVRISTAGGLGYKFWDDERRYLTAELGPAWLYENFRRSLVAGGATDDPSDDVFEDPDRNYTAARWALDLDHAVYDPATRLYHNHTLTTRIDDPNTLIFQSATGMKFNLIGAVNAGAEIQFDWNNDPAAGAVKDDLRYLLKLGYGF